MQGSNDRAAVLNSLYPRVDRNMLMAPEIFDGHLVGTRSMLKVPRRGTRGVVPV